MTCETLSPPAASGNSRESISAFLADPKFPCVGAKSALNKGRLETAQFGRLGSSQTTADLHASLLAYGDRYAQPGAVPVSFVAMFEDEPMGERTFEARLWEQLQLLHDLDHAQGRGWASGVSADPSRSDFSFSVAGRAYFVVGLHPKASRLARRTPFPCLVFNFHEQFEMLKASGKYARMQDSIRARDIALQGSINPVLARFGESSEARQYSGRAVDAGWKCPFHSLESTHD